MQYNKCFIKESLLHLGGMATNKIVCALSILLNWNQSETAFSSREKEMPFVSEASRVA